MKNTAEEGKGKTNKTKNSVFILVFPFLFLPLHKDINFKNIEYYE